MAVKTCMARSRAAWLRSGRLATGILRGRTMRDKMKLVRVLLLAVGELFQATCRFRFCVTPHPALPLLS